jgi:xanthine dehydrogenase large subunit
MSETAQRDDTPVMLQERRIRGGVNTALPHDSAARHVSGEAVYLDDMPELPGTVHLYVAISTRPHARIVALDTSVVRQQPGVVCVLTAADIPGVNDASPIFGDDPVFAVDEVQYAGQSIFVVAAETIEAARAAANLARIEYEDLPALITVDDALAANADLLPAQTMLLGDVDAALRKAPHRISSTVRTGGQDHFYLEGQIAYAIPGEGGDMVVYSSTQHPSEVQHNVAKALALPEHAVTVEVRRLGGGFGGKESQPSLFATIAALAAHKTGRRSCESIATTT